MIEGTPRITHHVLIGYEPSSSTHLHIIGVQSRQGINLSVMIHELLEEVDPQTQGDDLGLTIVQMLIQLSMKIGAGREQLITLEVSSAFRAGHMTGS